MMRRAAVAAAALTGILASQAPALSIYLATRPPPLQYTRRWIEPAVVAPGGEIVVRVESAATAAGYENCHATVRRTIVDAAGVETKYVAEARPTSPSVSIRLTVPLGAAVGPATYRAHADWTCNIVQAWRPYPVDLPELHFTIAPADGQGPDLEKQGIWTPVGGGLSFAETSP